MKQAPKRELWEAEIRDELDRLLKGETPSQDSAIVALIREVAFDHMLSAVRHATTKSIGQIIIEVVHQTVRQRIEALVPTVQVAVEEALNEEFAAHLKSSVRDALKHLSRGLVLSAHLNRDDEEY